MQMKDNFHFGHFFPPMSSSVTSYYLFLLIYKYGLNLCESFSYEIYRSLNHLQKTIRSFHRAALEQI